MGRTSNTDKVRRWQTRVRSASRTYKQWDEKFDTAKLEEYYLGPEQWGEGERDKYKINLVFPTIEIRKPSLLFYRPGVSVTARPARADDPETAVNVRAQLQQDVLGSVVDDKRNGFLEQTTLALHEAFFRFGVMEVGYTADFIDNPNAGRPVLKEDGKPQVDSSDQEVLHPDKQIESEGIFFRWIPADQFRVSATNKNRLEWNDWCGYFEWVHLEDVKANPRYKNTSGIKATAVLRKQARETGDDADSEHEGMVRLWKIWDLRAKVRHVFLDGWDKFLIQDEPWDYLPLATLKFHPILNSFYPLPPVYNWIDPQREFNETRESQRLHRRRFVRRYTVRRGGIEPDEMAKLEEAEDGGYVWHTGEPPISPVADAPLDYSVTRNVGMAKDDFQHVSGVSGEQRGVSDSETATQAAIVDNRLQIRESFARAQVAEWLGDVLTIALRVIRTKMALPFWVRRVVDPLGPQAQQEVANVAQQWELIRATELGDLEYDVSVDVEALSPATEETKRQQWGELLMLLGNPALLMALLASETLLKRTLGFYGIRDSKSIAEFTKGMKAILGPMMQMGQQGGPQTPGGVNQPPAPGATPDMGQMMGQLADQMGVQQ